MKTLSACVVSVLAACVLFAVQSMQPQTPASAHVIILHAARLLDVESGHVTSPGEILISGDTIREVGAKVSRPSGAEFIDLGGATLLPGLIDAHGAPVSPSRRGRSTNGPGIRSSTNHHGHPRCPRRPHGGIYRRARHGHRRRRLRRTLPCATPSTPAASPAHDCASAATPWIFSADMKTPSVSTRSSERAFQPPRIANSAADLVTVIRGQPQGGRGFHQNL